MARTIRFFCIGKPQQRGSKQAFVPLNPKTKQPYRDKNGRIVVNVVDDNKRSKPWMDLVKKTARLKLRGQESFTGFVGVTLTFYFERPKCHYGSGVSTQHILRDDAPEFPATKDIDKLTRAVHDACGGICYIDDKFVADAQQKKRWGTPERVEIEITELEVSKPETQTLFAKENTNGESLLRI